MEFPRTRIHKYNQDFNMRKAVIVSGYFNPLHKGHLELFKKAREFSDDYLIVIVNSDLQRELKGSKEFQDENEFERFLNDLVCEYSITRFYKPSLSA